MKLRRKELCPIHRSFYCCGREPIQKGSRVRRFGVERIEDPHHPRGYRELRSNAEMRKLVNRKIVEQNQQCAICQVAFTNYSDIVPDHIDPRGMGGTTASTDRVSTDSRQKPQSARGAIEKLSAPAPSKSKTTSTTAWS